MPPELLYEIYKYLPIDAYITLRDLGLKQLSYLVEAFRNPLEAKLIYFNGKPTGDLMRGVEYIAMTNPGYSFWWDAELWPVIEWATIADDPRLVQIVLTDLSIDPSEENNFLIGFAAESGSLEVVKLLLTDPRVNPADDDNSAIILAAQSGQLEVIKHLLTDPRVDPTACNNCAITEAFYCDFPDVVKLLFQDERVHSTLNSEDEAIVMQMIDS